MGAIKELYYGNIGSSEDIQPSKEWHAKSKEILTATKVLENILNEQQQSALEDLKNSIYDQFAIERADVYEHALAVGIGLGYESKKMLEE